MSNPSAKPRRARAGILRLGTALIAVTAGIAIAGELPADGHRSLYADTKAHRVGDTVQVLVLESTQAESSAGTGLAGSNGLTVAGRADNSAAGGNLSLAGDARGNGQTSRSGSVRSIVTAQVTAITADGNLVLDASQEVVVNDEKQRIVVHGIARPLDISADNYVPSNRLAQATIRIDGSGPVAGAQKTGVIFRFLKWMHLL